MMCATTQSICAIWLIHTCDMAHTKCPATSSRLPTSRRKLFFAECRLFYRALLQKRPMIANIKTQSNVWCEVFICVPRLINMCDTTHLCDTNPSWVCHDPLICVKRLIRMCDLTHSYLCHDSFIRVPWLIHIGDTTHSYAWLDPFMCAMTHSYVCHDSSICATWLIHTCAMTHYNVPCSSFKAANIASPCTYMCVWVCRKPEL